MRISDWSSDVCSSDLRTSMTSGPRATPVVVTLDGDNAHLSNLCGPLDDNLQQIARAYGVTLGRRGSRVSIRGDQARSEERRVGKEGVRTGRSRWSPDQ